MKKKLAIPLMLLALVVGLLAGSQLTPRDAGESLVPSSELQAWTEMMVIPPGEKGEVDPELVQSALDRAVSVAGPQGADWDAATLFNVILVNKAFKDPRTGQRVFTTTTAIPALDMTTGRVSYKEFIILFLNPEEQTPEVLDRCLTFEILRGLANRRMLVDQGLPPIPGFIMELVRGQMEQLFPGYNGHPIPESQGGPPRHPSQGSKDLKVPPAHQHSSLDDQLRAVSPIPYSVRSESKA